MIYLLVAILVIALVGLGLINLGLARKHSLTASDIDEIRGHWGKIETMMRDGHDAAWAQAIISADKLLDLVMVKKRVPGENLGSRLKNGSHLFHNVQNVWEAHKFRNHIAHEMNAHISRQQAERIINLFKQALRELKAL